MNCDTFDSSDCVGPSGLVDEYPSSELDEVEVEDEESTEDVEGVELAESSCSFTVSLLVLLVLRDDGPASPGPRPDMNRRGHERTTRHLSTQTARLVCNLTWSTRYPRSIKSAGKGRANLEQPTKWK